MKIETKDDLEKLLDDIRSAALSQGPLVKESFLPYGSLLEGTYRAVTCLINLPHGKHEVIENALPVFEDHSTLKILSYSSDGYAILSKGYSGKHMEIIHVSKMCLIQAAIIAKAFPPSSTEEL